MKKLIIAILLVLAFATPAWAGEPWEEYGVELPSIEGDKHFTETIVDALELLYEYDAAHFALVTQNVDYILVSSNDEKTPDGKDAAARTNGAAVFFMPKYINNRLFTPEIAAGTLAHEASHSASYNVSGPYDDAKKEELMASENELAAYKLVGAPEWAIKQVEKRITELRN